MVILMTRENKTRDDKEVGVVWFGNYYRHVEPEDDPDDDSGKDRCEECDIEGCFSPFLCDCPIEDMCDLISTTGYFKLDKGKSK